MPPKTKPRPNGSVKRAAIYVRVSSDAQVEDGTSLKTQRADLTAYAERQGWHVVRVWEDGGVSGARETEDRPALAELMASIRGGAVDVLLVAAWDRLARNMRAQLDIWHQLDGLGVEYFSMNEPNSSGEEGAFVRHIMASVAEEERRKIRQRTSRGRRAAVTAGGWGGGDLAPFGYRVVKTGDKSVLEPDPVEAETVRRMVSLIVDERLPTSRVAEILNAEGRLPRRAARWTMALVRNHAARSVDNWAGRWTYGKGTAAGEITVILPSPVLSPERAEALRLAVATTATVRSANTIHPLTGRIVCLECGRVCTGVRRGDGRARRYLCSNSKGQVTGGKETRCVSPTIHGPALDAAVWAAIRPYLERPDLLLAEAAHAAQETGSLPAAEATVEACRQALADVVSRGIRMGLDDATIAAMKVGAQADYDAAVRYRDQIAQQIAAAEASSAALARVADLAERMSERLDDPSDETMRDVFRALDVRAVVRSYSPLRVDVTGRVAFEELAAAVPTGGGVFTPGGLGTAPPLPFAFPVSA